MIEILVVEDVEEMRELVLNLLAAIPGVHVSGSVGDSASARLEASRRKPHWVLLDEVLPGESSLDLAAELSRSGIGVILMTGDESALSRPLPPVARGRCLKPDWDTLDTDCKRWVRQWAEFGVLDEQASNC